MDTNLICSLFADMTYWNYWCQRDHFSSLCLCKLLSDSDKQKNKIMALLMCAVMCLRQKNWELDQDSTVSNVTLRQVKARLM